MAFGRTTRPDGNKRTFSYCSTMTIAVFVALSLIGVWMMTSSTIVPVEITSIATKSEMKGKRSQTDSRPSEDGSASIAQDSAGGAGKNNDNAVPSKSNYESVDMTENLIDKSQENQSKEKNHNEVDSDADQETEAGDQSKDRGKEKDKSSKETDNFEQTEPEDGEKSEQDEKSEGDKIQDGRDQKPLKGKAEQNELKKEQENKEENQSNLLSGNEVHPSGAQSELLSETNNQNEAWSTQAVESKNEREVQMSSSSKGQVRGYNWKLCKATAGADYIPCLDNEAAIKKLHSTKHYEHRERHCPEEPPTCLVPLPDGYKQPIKWPKSREKIWYTNVPHTKLVAIKGHQNWVKVSGEYLTFPGGGTQFKHGALHYIDFIQQALPDIAWGKRSRVILDVGCGVASFGGYLFERDVLTMSFAPKDEHEAQVQFALERGIPAISAVMGTKRLPFPSKVFDVIHCARCRVPWHIEGGLLLLELNRLLRPGGYFVWSATPVYRNLSEDVGIWKAMSALTKSMCWKMVAKRSDKLNQVGLVIYRKPLDNKCYVERAEENPPLCQESDDPDAAWNVSMQACMHKLPVDVASRGTRWPELWPLRLEKAPYWLSTSQIGIYGKPAPEDFKSDYERWKRVVSKSYASGLGINWSNVRNVMDMRSVYGGFAAALRDMDVWVMNIVPVDAPDTLPIVYERGLFGIYHDWCESFSTYPRTYDLLHADHLFSKVKKRCQLVPILAEVDRILRPEGKLIVRDKVDTISEIENIAKSLHWEIRMTYSEGKEGLLCVQKTMWRPTEVETSMPSMS